MCGRSKITCPIDFVAKFNYYIARERRTSVSHLKRRSACEEVIN